MHGGALLPTLKGGSGHFVQLMQSGEDDGYTHHTKSLDFGKTWNAPKRTALPNPDTKMSGHVTQDGTLLLAFNNSTRKARKTPLVLSGSFDGEGLDWSDLVVLEDDPKGCFQNPSIAVLKGGSVVVGYSQGEKAFGKTGRFFQFRGIKASGVALNIPRLKVTRGKQAVAVRDSRMVFDYSIDEDKHPAPSSPCLSLIHPPLYSLFNARSTDRVEIKLPIFSRMKVTVATPKTKGHQVTYSGLVEDSTELYFPDNSTIQHRVLTLKGIEADALNVLVPSFHDTRAYNENVNKEAASLVAISILYNGVSVTEEYESPVTAEVQVEFGSMQDGPRQFNVSMDAEKVGEAYKFQTEITLRINRIVQYHPTSQSNIGYNYALDLLFDENVVATHEWKNIHPFDLRVGCGRTIRGACKPRNVGMCSKQFDTKFSWAIDSFKIESKQYAC